MTETFKKLSKSDKIDKEQEAKDKELLDNPKLSMHFKKSTYVVVYGKGRGEILDIIDHPGGETLLRIRWDDGSVSLIKPMALSR